MNSFTFQCGTKMIFGKGAEKGVGSELKAFGAHKVLLVYGGQSIKKSGLYGRVCDAMRESGLSWLDLPGVVPNPRVSLVRKGIELCRENGVDFLLAVGGGSVIDTCKAISFGVFYEGDVWDLVVHKAEPGTQRLPVATILTLPAAGSEESDSCVISDETLHIKGGFGSPLMRPVFSILNPELTYTLPPYQTACGCMDIMAHAMERYFSQTKHVEVTDRMGEAMMKVIIHNLPLALADPCNEAARSEIMLAGTWAQNDMTGPGREQDWFNHGLEHQISGFYDIAHGAGLAVVWPAYLRFFANHGAAGARLLRYAVKIWGAEPDFEHPERTINAGIERTRAYFDELGMPRTLRELGLGEEDIPLMCVKYTDNGAKSYPGILPIGIKEAEEIFRLCL